jgi:malate dehydrogenase (oxaloacetate-decarboxylating)(NADP+)
MGNTFAALMVRQGDADAMVTGALHAFPEALRPALQIIGLRDETARISGVHMITHEGRLYFFADTSVNIEPSAEELAQIAINTAQLARFFDVEPRVAMLSFSTFGSVHHPAAQKMAAAADIVRLLAPALPVEGEIAPDVALSPELVERSFPQSVIKGDANVLVFPDLSSGNIAYKIVERLAGAEVVGPILMGFAKPVCVLPQGATVENIVHMAGILSISTDEPETFGVAAGVSS